MVPGIVFLDFSSSNSIFQFASNEAKDWYVLVNSTKAPSIANQSPYNVENMSHFEKMNIIDTTVVRATEIK